MYDKYDFLRYIYPEEAFERRIKEETEYVQYNYLQSVLYLYMALAISSN